MSDFWGGSSYWKPGSFWKNSAASAPGSSVQNVQLGPPTPPIPPVPPTNAVGHIGLAVAVAGYGSGGFAGTIGLNVAVAGVGRAAALSAGSIGLSVAVAGAGSLTGASHGDIGLNVAVAGVGSTLALSHGDIALNIGVAGVGNAPANHGDIALNIGVAGVGSISSGATHGVIGLNVAVAGVGSTSSGVSHGNIALNIAPAGVGSGGSSSIITTMTLLNTSGTVQPIGSCTQIFGLAFKQGDIPAGRAPLFTTSGSGTVIAFSMSKKPAVWPDGSMKHAAFILRLPVTIAGSGTLSINISNVGSTPTPSSRTTADFTAGGLDLNVLVTGQDNLSGDWTSNLAQGISAALSDNRVELDGDAGKVWRIRANFRQSSADHGQLEGWWYVTALTDSSGNLGGIRHITRVIQPLYNETLRPPQYRSFTAYKTRNGSTTLVDLMTTMPTSKTFTWSGSGVLFNATAHGWTQSCIAAKVTNSGGSGGLPTGLNDTQLYAIALSGSNQFGLGVNFQGVAADGEGACVTPTGAGTGTNTITFYPMVSQFGSLFTAQANGLENYIQGTGSLASDSTILCQTNAAYLCRTKLLAPYALTTYNPTSNPTYTYFPGTAGPVYRNTATTGERYDIGPVPSWYVRHLFTQAAVDDRAVRVIGLVGGHLPVALYDKTTRSIPVGNNGHANNGVTYSGMPAVNVDFRWNIGRTSGFTPPTDTNVYSQGWTSIDTSHLPALEYYPYLVTGAPYFKDMLAEYGNNGLCNQYTNQDTAVVDGSHNIIGGVRNSLINGTVYRGTFSGESGIRSVAWAARDIAAPGIANFENSSWNTYFADVLASTTDGMAAYRGMLVSGANAYVTNNGMWDEGPGNNGGMWGVGYFIGAFTLAYGDTQNANALAQANYMVKWPQHVGNVMGTYPVGCYRQTIRKGANYNSLYSTSDSQIGFYRWGVTWSSATNLFTQVSGLSLGNGDILVWNPSEGGSPPSGLSSWTGYYVINKSGATFQLSTSLGGSAITLVDTNAVENGVYVQITLAHNPATGALDNQGASSYHANVTAVSNWLNAIGGTVDASYLTSMSARLATFPNIVAEFNADPKYAIQSTYV